MSISKKLSDAHLLFTQCLRYLTTIFCSKNYYILTLNRVNIPSNFHATWNILTIIITSVKHRSSSRMRKDSWKEWEKTLLSFYMIWNILYNIQKQMWLGRNLSYIYHFWAYDRFYKSWCHKAELSIFNIHMILTRTDFS